MIWKIDTIRTALLSWVKNMIVRRVRFELVLSKLQLKRYRQNPISKFNCSTTTSTDITSNDLKIIEDSGSDNSQWKLGQLELANPNRTFSML